MSPRLRRASDPAPRIDAGSWQGRLAEYPQLPPERQAELVAAFQKGLEARRLIDEGRLDARGLAEARRAVRAGEEAMEQLVGANIRLMTLIAREKAEERFGRERALEMLPDLLGEANVALVEAARIYDPARGPSFPAYLAKAVRDRVLMSLAAQHPIRTPPAWVRIKRIYTARHQKLAAELGRPPTIEEMKEDLLDVCLEWAEARLSPDERRLPSPERRKVMMDRLRKQGMLGAISRLEQVLQTTQHTTSTEAPVNDDGGMLSDLLGEEVDFVGRVALDELREAVDEVLGSLPYRDRMIIRYRYGFEDGTQWTYSRISKEFGVTAERIRQLEKAVLERLRVPGAHYSLLASHLDKDVV